MSSPVKTAIMISSLILNLAFIALVAAAALNNTASVSFPDHGASGVPYTTGACLVSVPEGANIVFPPVEITLRPGEQAALQFSAFLRGAQVNIAFEPLYDPLVLSVDPSPFGLTINARLPGETIVQAVSGQGIRDLARVVVE